MTKINWTAALVSASSARLSNGLRAVAHRDSKAPLVAVYVGYGAGSRDEPESKAGLAHICEHLMYTGTPSFPGSYFAPMERVGAVWTNAHVREDYSAYFTTVPVAALDFVLRIETDRMVHLGQGIDSAKVDLQREVVRNELRQRESAPFGRATRIIAELASRAKHPYAHPPDGILEQLDNISCADAREWIEKWHCAWNAVVVVAGDIDPEAAIESVRARFESITQDRRGSDREPADGLVNNRPCRRTIEEPAERGRLYMVWNGPAFGAAEAAALEVACEIIGGGRGSRLSRHLIDSERLASDVTFQMRHRILGSQMIFAITANPGVPLDQVEAVAAREIERLSSSGIDSGEVEAARLRIFARLVRELEPVGGPNSKSEALGVATMLGSGPHMHNERVAAISAMKPEGIAAAAGRWLSANRAILEMRAAG